MAPKIKTTNMLEAAASPNDSSGVKQLDREKSAHQAVLSTTAGAGTATVEVQGSIDETNWDVVGTITLSAPDENTPDSDSFTMDAAYPFIRHVLTAISGTGAAVNSFMGKDTGKN